MPLLTLSARSCIRWTMPQRAQRPCPAGCGRLTIERYCPPCTTARERQRGTSTRRGYGPRHQALRAQLLAREPYCRLHLREVGQPPLIHPTARERVAMALLGIPLATVRDHIVPMTQGGPDTIENSQPLCKACHDRKTMGEVREACAAIR